MTKSRLQKLRLIAFQKQRGLCFYCGLPMWESAVESFAAQHGLSIAQAKIRQCTAEHLVAEQDGGKATPENIVAACAWCNHQRHAGRPHDAPDPPTYRTLVAECMKMGGWHPAGIAAVIAKMDV